jgi:phage regulator Rha-like protein
MKHSSSLPYVFTEHGVAMLASVLKSDRAVKTSINIIKAFVKLREMLSTNKELAHKLAQLERKIEKHDEEIRLIFDAIRQLMTPSEPKRKSIGFLREKEK